MKNKQDSCKKQNIYVHSSTHLCITSLFDLNATSRISPTQDLDNNSESILQGETARHCLTTLLKGCLPTGMNFPLTGIFLCFNGTLWGTENFSLRTFWGPPSILDCFQSFCFETAENWWHFTTNLGRVPSCAPFLRWCNLCKVQYEMVTARLKMLSPEEIWRLFLKPRLVLIEQQVPHKLWQKGNFHPSQAPFCVPLHRG